MSLLIHLPLTKDLRNQGLADVTVTNNGATFDSNGKLGGCYSFDGNDDFVSLNGSALYDAIKGAESPFSIAMWIYRADSTRAILFGDYGLSGSIGFNVELNTNHSMRFYWNGTPDASGSHTLATLNAWTHLAITYDGTKICFYANGTLTDTYTVTLTTKTKTSGMYYLGRDSRTGSTAFNGKMNDFRIYNHTLSQKEISDLKNALILHYPLDNNGWGQENLLKNSNFLQGTNGMQGYTATMATCTKQTDCMKVVSTSASGGFYTSNFDSIATGDMTTFSADVKADSNMTIYIGTDGSGNGSCQAYMVGTSWQRISISKAKTTNNANLRIYGNGTFYVKNLKYELGSIATPWCPNFSDALATTMGLNDNVEYDTSGFGNNGTRVGEFSWTSDTPKYNVSTVFDSTNRTGINFPNEANPRENITISLWGYKDDWDSAERLGGKASSSSGWCIGDYSSENTMFGFYLESGNGGYNTISGFRQLSSGWHHFAITFDGFNLKYYLDGECVNTKTWETQQYFKVGTGVYNLGSHTNSSYYFNGNLSDFRIYATALSPEDILSLYQTSAYIDSQGNTYASSYVEG